MEFANNIKAGPARDLYKKIVAEEESLYNEHTRKIFRLFSVTPFRVLKDADDSYPLYALVSTRLAWLFYLEDPDFHSFYQELKDSGILANLNEDHEILALFEKA
jgi:hypothetical protein